MPAGFLLVFGRLQLSLASQCPKPLFPTALTHPSASAGHLSLPSVLGPWSSPLLSSELQLCQGAGDGGAGFLEPVAFCVTQPCPGSRGQLKAPSRLLWS